MRPIVFDLEIKNLIPNPKEALIPGGKYCEGWGDPQGMGISVLCTEDMKTGEVLVLCDDNKEELAKLIADPEVLFVSWYGLGFDAKVILANWHLILPPERHYDLCKEIKAAAGPGKGYTLDAVAKANGLQGKNGNGALAPWLWQQGKFGQLTTYCLNDVTQTRQLMDEVMSFGTLKTPDGRTVEMRDPFENFPTNTVINPASLLGKEAVDVAVDVAVNAAPAVHNSSV